MGARLNVKNTIRSDGYIFFPNFMKGQSSLDVANVLGEVMSLAESIPLVQSLGPRDKTQKINTYSDLYGVEKFPMHSDFAHWQIPPRFLLLRAPQRSVAVNTSICLLYTSPSPRDGLLSRMPSSA